MAKETSTTRYFPHATSLGSFATDAVISTEPLTLYRVLSGGLTAEAGAGTDAENAR